ncbi:MAG: glutathione S-transferase N-terminal domain-containing protein [SAR324 cluster bacterium]|nr:glutathione S-transferase N-terminal domain-containing protein [SAR324 cluster bacterium]
MIDLYSWPTPNGHKAHIMLEETGLPYTVIPVDIGAGDQFDAGFLAINPNHRIPAIVDHDGPGGKDISVFESGAILIYLAEKSGKFLPGEAHPRMEALQWLMWQMGGVGPMFGQANHFRSYAPEPVPYAIERYTKEVRRLYGVMDKRLAQSPFLAGDYTIADIATYPWTLLFKRYEIEMDEFPNAKRWQEQIGARPAVQTGMEVLKDKRRQGPMSEEAWRNLFGDTQYQRR